MPYYDLNVPWSAGEPHLQRTIAFLDELGYNVIALSHTLAGKLPSNLSSPIPEKLPFQVPAKTHVLRRCTLVLADPSQNHRVSSLSQAYDILALRPTNEKSLQLACQSLDCDIISIDLTQRLDYHFKIKMLSQAIERGVKIEICYSPAIMATDVNARRNLIGNVTQLIRATKGRGLIISSEAARATGCRGPDDVINLAAVWGLGQERGKEAITKLARHAVVSAQMKRTSFRGVVDVVNGGKKPEAGSTQGQQKKRKAESQEGGANANASRGSDEAVTSKPLSKREQKRRKKAAAVREHAEN